MGAFPRGAKGRARVNSRAPQAAGICDRTGFRVQHNALAWQHEFAGNQLQNRRLLVRPQSLDKPNPQLRTYAVPADPTPIQNPRPDMADMVSSFTPYLTDEFGVLILDEFQHPIVTSQPQGPTTGPPGMPPLPVSTLIPLRDDDGNIIVDGLGNVIFVDDP